MIRTFRSRRPETHHNIRSWSQTDLDNIRTIDAYERRHRATRNCFMFGVLATAAVAFLLNGHKALSDAVGQQGMQLTNRVADRDADSKKTYDKTVVEGLLKDLNESQRLNLTLIGGSVLTLLNIAAGRRRAAGANKRDMKRAVNQFKQRSA